MKLGIRILNVSGLLLFFKLFSCAQPLNQKKIYTKQDTLRGSINANRDWWDVQQYGLEIMPDILTKTIKGINTVHFLVVKGGRNKKMQIDLQAPMKMDSIIWNNKIFRSFKRSGNTYILDFANYKFIDTSDKKVPQKILQSVSLKCYFSGKPREAIRPPWQGGWIWEKDELGRPWITVACQGLGASVWYPCKDHQSDEPDKGATISITVPDSLSAVANGRLINKEPKKKGTTIWTWQVKNPINNYNIVPYIGKYTYWSENFIGETEKNLSLDYWVLDYNLEKAKKQFSRDVKPMLTAFEYWFGPYPFYDDGFKLVESPYLGMEHQSAIAYGNHYLNGYLGSDLSGSGWGLKWDYIIIHESGHEWFGNNITTNDIADMWVHEGFTMYSEVLFTEYLYGKEAANEYAQGLQRGISNNIPVIGPYGVNKEGSGDMYNKGACLIHMIRQIINNDSIFRKILRGLNIDFFHKTINSKEVEQYINSKSGINFSKMFDQYLRTKQVPVLEYKIEGKTLRYRWTNCVKDFDMPVYSYYGKNRQLIKPTQEWANQFFGNWIEAKEFRLDENFYIKSKKIN
ncbi:MAG: M1 family metallopeptidase [Chitinophagaceae bacterium]|nr:M1 family metallopeptidase [Chitinophagaceae bacterium]